MVFVELVLCIAADEARLAYSCIAHQQQPQQHIVAFRHCAVKHKVLSLSSFCVQCHRKTRRVSKWPRATSTVQHLIFKVAVHLAGLFSSTTFATEYSSDNTCVTVLTAWCAKIKAITFRSSNHILTYLSTYSCKDWTSLPKKSLCSQLLAVGTTGICKRNTKLCVNFSFEHIVLFTKKKNTS